MQCLSVSSRIVSPVDVRPPYPTLTAALEAGARDGAPFVTFHTGREAVERDQRATLAGAHRWARALSANGVRRGNRVLLLMTTGPDFVEAMLGTQQLGAIPVPLASPMTFGGMERYLRNLQAIADDAGARTLVTTPRVRDTLARDGSLHASIATVLTAAELDGFGTDTHVFRDASSTDIALIQYTSGTTGRPKGVVISHRALVSNAYAIAHGLHLTHRDVGVSWLPLFHDMGLIGVLLTALCHPYPLHLLSPEGFVMRPQSWLRLLARVRGTLSAAPNFGYELCATRADLDEVLELGAWRLALNGSEPVHPTTARRFAERFESYGFSPSAMLPVYGMAEATLAVAFASPGEGVSVLATNRERLEREGVAVDARGAGGYAAVSVGGPVAGMSVRIVDEGGAESSERVVGTVQIAGPSVMDGYFGNETATREALRDGWLHTEDRGFVAGGKLYIVGRAKEMIIKGGRNIYPYDVERIAAEVSGVRRGGVAAFGVTNEASGTEDLCVVAETLERSDEARAAMEKEIRGELLAVLGVRVDTVRWCAPGALPRTTSGKIRRRACAAFLDAEAAS